MSKIRDFIDLDNCQEVAIPVYFYALAALCVVFALLHLFLISIALAYRAIGQLFCPSSRKYDYQVLKKDAQFRLEMELLD